VLIQPSYRQLHAPRPASSTYKARINRALVSTRSPQCLATASHNPQCLCLVSPNYNRNRNLVSWGHSNNSLVNSPCTVARPATRSRLVPPNPLSPLGKYQHSRLPRPLAAPRPHIVPSPVVQGPPLVLGLRVQRKRARVRTSKRRIPRKGSRGALRHDRLVRPVNLVVQGLLRRVRTLGCSLVDLWEAEERSPLVRLWVPNNNSDKPSRVHRS
jgi:hypothetical protein